MSTKIEWAGETWNPITGCTRVSAGCDNCYAVTMTRRLAAMGQEKYKGLVNEGKKHFNGVVKMHRNALDIPYDRKGPTTYFVNSMSDLFHKDVPFDFIENVWNVMHDNERHTFQILTKRPERMAEFLRWRTMSHGERYILPNVWIGTSVEDQQAANERIPYLVQVPAAVRFLSCEPLLGPVNLAEIRPENGPHWFNCLSEPVLHTGYMPNAEGLISWVIAGGESGHGARPMHPDWARLLRDQCASAGVAFFFKQWGNWAEGDHKTACVIWESGKIIHLEKDDFGFKIQGNGKLMGNVGKKLAGRLLDGEEHNAMPAVGA